MEQFIKSHMTDIAMAIIATLLVIYGDSINKTIKKHLKPYNFFVRTLAFVAICAFGYGAAIVFLTPYLASLLATINDLYLLPVIITIFVILGMLAERKRHI